MSKTPLSRQTPLFRSARSKTIAFVGAAAVLGAVAVGGAALLAPATAAAEPAAAAESAVNAVNERAQVRASLDTATTAMVDAAAVNADVKASGLDLGQGRKFVDTTGLRSAHDVLASHASDNAAPHTTLAVVVASYSERVESEVSEVRTNLDNAVAAKQAADAAAAKAAEEAAAAAQAAADAQAAANTPDGARNAARQLMSSQYGWGDDQFQCLDSLWTKESGWDYQAYNPSGATGIPQALPGDKMATIADDWATNAVTQITWGLGYISSVYGTPCSAWGHSQATNWY
ncbi:phospholipase [uncultured Microbacterium sp.]|uniref:aggregation-promoting factor C-terminal-like domain-containing protein n=1 Tax=uncultured Microbacterium sp. TaxID=191216 RepID=UPI0025D39F77|nr:phospholipase [uncultured Microbacterium sp.]